MSPAKVLEAAREEPPVGVDPFHARRAVAGEVFERAIRQKGVVASLGVVVVPVLEPDLGTRNGLFADPLLLGRAEREPDCRADRMVLDQPTQVAAPAAAHVENNRPR